MSTRTDRAEIERLIGRVALRDRAAFADLYDATSAKLFGVVWRVLNNRAEAEDALQDVYIRIWQKAGNFRPGATSPMTWLITVARNLAIDRLRSRRVRAEDGGEFPEVTDEAPTPEADAIAASERRALDACLEELSQDRAAAVRAAYLDGDSYKDLADRFEVPLNTMRTWLRRSLISLRKCLTQ